MVDGAKGKVSPGNCLKAFVSKTIDNNQQKTAAIFPYSLYLFYGNITITNAE